MKVSRWMIAGALALASLSSTLTFDGMGATNALALEPGRGVAVPLEEVVPIEEAPLFVAGSNSPGPIAPVVLRMRSDGGYQPVYTQYQCVEPVVNMPAAYAANHGGCAQCDMGSSCCEMPCCESQCCETQCCESQCCEIPCCETQCCEMNCCESGCSSCKKHGFLWRLFHPRQWKVFKHCKRFGKHKHGCDDCCDSGCESCGLYEGGMVSGGMDMGEFGYAGEAGISGGVIEGGAEELGAVGVREGQPYRVMPQDGRATVAPSLPRDARPQEWEEQSPARRWESQRPAGSSDAGARTIDEGPAFKNGSSHYDRHRSGSLTPPALLLGPGADRAQPVDENTLRDRSV